MEAEIDAADFIERFSRALLRMPKTARREMSLALRAAAQDVAKGARSLLRAGSSPSAPGQPPGRRTGALSRSIRTRLSRRGFTAYAFAAYGKSRKEGQYYALFLEEGTAPRFTRRRGPRGRLESRPFLTRALADAQPQISSRIEAAIAAILREEGA